MKVKEILSIFFGLAKSRYNNKVMYQIKDKNDALICDPREILKVQHKYYQKLYSRNDKTKFTLVN